MADSKVADLTQLTAPTGDEKYYIDDAAADKYITHMDTKNPVVSSETSSATPTINTDATEIHRITALALAITSMTTNLSGTPSHGQRLIIEILDDGTGRAITWGASFEDGAATLPTTTVASTKLYVGLFYNSTTSKWRCMAQG